MKITCNGIEIPDAQAGLAIRVDHEDAEEMGPIYILLSGVLVVRGTEELPALTLSGGMVVFAAVNGQVNTGDLALGFKLTDPEPDHVLGTP